MNGVLHWFMDLLRYQTEKPFDFFVRVSPASLTKVNHKNSFRKSAATLVKSKGVLEIRNESVFRVVFRVVQYLTRASNLSGRLKQYCLLC